VFAISNDPVSSGLVASLARPGGNITGLSTQATDVASKRVQLLSEVVPDLRRLAIIGNAGYADAVLEMAEVQRAARTVGLDAMPIEIRAPTDIAPAFQTLASSVHALFVVSDALVGANRKPIIALAFDHRMPTIFNDGSFVQRWGPHVARAKFPQPVPA
jgi:putative ABC transport system substrate-binding protein